MNPTHSNQDGTTLRVVSNNISSTNDNSHNGLMMRRMDKLGIGAAQWTPIERHLAMCVVARFDTDKRISPDAPVMIARSDFQAWCGWSMNTIMGALRRLEARGMVRIQKGRSDHANHKRPARYDWSPMFEYLDVLPMPKHPSPESDTSGRPSGDDGHTPMRPSGDDGSPVCSGRAARLEMTGRPSGDDASFPYSPSTQSTVRTCTGTPLLYLSTSLSQRARAREEQESCQSDDDEIEDEETTREPDPQPEEELVMSYEPIPKPVLDTPNASLPSGPMGQCVRKHLEINPEFRYKAQWCSQFRDLLSEYLELGGTVHDVMAMMDTCAEAQRLRGEAPPKWMTAYRGGLQSMIAEKRREIVEPAAREARRKPVETPPPSPPEPPFATKTPPETRRACELIEGWHTHATGNIVMPSQDKDLRDRWVERVALVQTDRLDALDKTIRTLIDNKRNTDGRIFRLAAIQVQIDAIITRAIKGDPDNKPVPLWKRMKTVMETYREKFSTSQDVGHFFRLEGIAAEVLANPAQLDSLIDQCHRIWPQSEREQLADRVIASLKGVQPGQRSYTPTPVVELTDEQHEKRLAEIRAMKARFDAHTNTQTSSSTNTTLPPANHATPYTDAQGLSKSDVQRLLQQELSSHKK